LLCGGALLRRMDNSDAIRSLHILLRLDGLATGMRLACARHEYGKRRCGHVCGGDWHERMTHVRSISTMGMHSTCMYWTLACAHQEHEA
jgi:hypothetical protein